jgi:hypothetical protein
MLGRIRFVMTRSLPGAELIIKPARSKLQLLLCRRARGAGIQESPLERDDFAFDAWVYLAPSVGSELWRTREQQLLRACDFRL